MAVFSNRVVAVLVWFCGHLIVEVTSTMVDMSHGYDNETIYWPGAKRFRLTTVFAGRTHKGYWYEINEFESSEHGGTHMDAPIHFWKGGWTIDEIPLDHLVAPAVVIDISERASIDADAQLMVEDLTKWEQKYGQLPEDCILFVNSGWDQWWSNRTAYLGTQTNDTSTLHFPGVHKDASGWLVENRKLVGIGIDTPSLDFGQSTHFESHVTFFAHNVYGLENVKNAGKLPVTGATVYVMPMKIRGGSGAPLRLLATWDTTVNSGGSGLGHSLSSNVLFLILFVHLAFIAKLTY